MVYLFWAFAAVWIGIFLYLHALVRRSRVLERQLAELLERSRLSPRPGPSMTGPRAGGGRP
jgi:CcmD family protein